MKTQSCTRQTTQCEMGGLDTKPGPVRTAHICVHTIAYHCHTQHNTEQF